MANPLIPIGSKIIEPCPKCRTKVNSNVDKKNHVFFDCPVCHHVWNYHIMGDGKGSRFTAQDLEALMNRNPALKVSDPFKQKS